MIKYKIPKGKLQVLDIRKVYPDPTNVRQTLNREKLEGLATSLEFTNYLLDGLLPGGMIQPVAVNKKNGRYKIISGHRRYYASIALRHREIFTKVYHNLTHEQEKLIQLAENETKVPYKKNHTAHNLFEFYKLMLAYESEIKYPDVVKADTYDELEKVVNGLYPERNLGDIYPISEFAEMINKSLKVIRGSFRFVTLDKRLQQEVDKGNLSYSASIQIARLPKKKSQYGFWQRIKDKKWSAKRIGKEIKEELQQKEFILGEEEKRSIPSYLMNLYMGLNEAIRFLKSFLTIEKIDDSVWNYGYAIKLNGGLIGLFDTCGKSLDRIRSKIKENSGYLDWLEKYGDKKRETLQERLIRELKKVKCGKTKKRAFDFKYLILDQIVRDPRQPRKNFEGLEELAKTFNEVGQIHPILVRPAKLCSYVGKKDKNKFMIIAGERRWRAANLDISRLKRLEAMVIVVYDSEARVLQYEEDLFDEVLLSERAEALYNLFKMQRQKKGKKYTVGKFAKQYKHLGTQAVLDALKYHSLDKKLKDLHQAGLLRYNSVIRIGEIEDKDKRFEFALESILLDYKDEDVEEKLQKESRDEDQLEFISKKEIKDMEIKGRRQMLIQTLSHRLHGTCALVKRSLEKKTYSHHTVIRKYYELFKLFEEANELMETVMR